MGVSRMVYPADSCAVIRLRAKAIYSQLLNFISQHSMVAESFEGAMSVAMAKQRELEFVNRDQKGMREELSRKTEELHAFQKIPDLPIQLFPADFRMKLLKKVGLFSLIVWPGS